MPTPRRNTPALPVNGLLDWSDSQHFAQDQRPCRYCGSPTHLRDDTGRPAGKVCTEEALAPVVQALAMHGAEGRL